MSQMTKEELADWEDRHDEVIRQESRWAVLGGLLMVSTLILAVAGRPESAWILFGLGVISLCVHRSYMKEHARIDDERDDGEE